MRILSVISVMSVVVGMFAFTLAHEWAWSGGPFDLDAAALKAVATLGLLGISFGGALGLVAIVTADRRQ